MLLLFPTTLNPPEIAGALASKDERMARCENTSQAETLRRRG